MGKMVDFQRHMRVNSFLSWATIAMEVGRKASDGDLPTEWFEAIRNGPVEMTVTVGGVEFDPEVFFERVEEQLDRMVAEEARKQVAEAFGEGVSQMRNTLREAMRVVRRRFDLPDMDEEQGDEEFEDLCGRAGL